MNRNEPIK